MNCLVKKRDGPLNPINNDQKSTLQNTLFDLLPNELLNLNYVCLKAFLGTEQNMDKAIIKKLDYLNMKKIWSITTTLRNPDRLRSFFIVLYNHQTCITMVSVKNSCVF